MPGLADLLAAATTLPGQDIVALADAVRGGPEALDRMWGRTGSAEVRQACAQVLQLLDEYPGDYLAGWLSGAAGASQAARSAQEVDVVWTGPESEVDTARFTSQVVVNLIEQAEERLLLASYATNPNHRTIAALTDAGSRGVDITVLYERSADNPAYHSPHDALPRLPIRRLVWPARHRPPGAALHPKFIVVDDRIALVGSANLTGRALDNNIECGVLLSGGPHPKAICDHIWSLVRTGVFTAIHARSS